MLYTHSLVKFNVNTTRVWRRDGDAPARRVVVPASAKKKPPLQYLRKVYIYADELFCEGEIVVFVRARVISRVVFA